MLRIVSLTGSQVLIIALLLSQHTQTHTGRLDVCVCMRVRKHTHTRQTDNNSGEKLQLFFHPFEYQSINHTVSLPAWLSPSPSLWTITKPCATSCDTTPPAAQWHQHELQPDSRSHFFFFVIRKKKGRERWREQEGREKTPVRLGGRRRWEIWKRTKATESSLTKEILRFICFRFKETVQLILGFLQTIFTAKTYFLK